MENELKISFKKISAQDFSDVEKKLFDAAAAARQNAYAVYSNFFVGCAILLENGEIHTGSNQENAAFPSGLCAERTTLFWVSANFPQEKISKIFVIGAPNSDGDFPPCPPCGACRQAILEYEVKQQKNIQMYFSSRDGTCIHTASVRNLLPFSFDSNFLD